jgi:hypothetical protein
MSVAMILLGISFSMNNPDEEAIIPCVSKIVAFKVKNIDAIIFFACFVGCLDFSHKEI